MIKVKVFFKIQRAFVSKRGMKPFSIIPSLNPLKDIRFSFFHTRICLNLPTPYEIQIEDGGIDGRLAFDGTPIQSKKKRSFKGYRFRALYEPAKQHGRGVFITQPKATKQRANKWRSEGLDIQLLSIPVLILAGKFREQPLRARAT